MCIFIPERYCQNWGEYSQPTWVSHPPPREGSIIHLAPACARRSRTITRCHPYYTWGQQHGLLPYSHFKYLAYDKDVLGKLCATAFGHLDPRLAHAGCFSRGAHEHWHGAIYSVEISLCICLREPVVFRFDLALNFSEWINTSGIFTENVHDTFSLSPPHSRRGIPSKKDSSY